MQSNLKLSKDGYRPGMTLIELSVVILVLLTLLAMTFIGINAWKRGSDRAGCLMNIRNVQMAVRAYTNTNGLNPGTNSASQPVPLQTALFGAGRYLPATPTCPANGVYTLSGDNIPNIGTLYMTCSLEVSHRHVPENYADW